MEVRGELGRRAAPTAVTYCIVPSDLAAKLHEPLRKHFRDDSGIDVVVERRALDRRRRGERRAKRIARADLPERRLIQATAGRRAGDRRSPAIAIEPRSLPRAARRHAERLIFIERVEPAALDAEDADTARVIARVQAGDQEGFGEVYSRYFERVYGYARLVLGDTSEAEDITQQVFLDALQSLPGYRERGKPFRAWLFTIARNRTLTRLKQLRRIDVVDPATVSDVGERDAALDVVAPIADDVLGWISDHELHLFIERLPLPQRQVLVLVYLLGLSAGEAAEVLGRSPAAVRQQQSRALAFLRARLTAVGRAPRGGRVGTRILLRQAVVLRSRRYALSPRAPGR